MRKTVLMRGGYILLALFAVLAFLIVPADAQSPKKTLVVALNQDPDILDPTPVPHLRGPDHLRAHVREALRAR